MSRLPSLGPGMVLSPDDLKVVGEALFGAWGWQTRLAEQLEVDGSTVRRWVSGAVSVPGPVKVALRLMLERQGLAPVRPPLPRSPDKTPARPRSARRS
jgi:hypothetical protein